MAYSTGIGPSSSSRFMSGKELPVRGKFRRKVQSFLQPPQKDERAPPTAVLALPQPISRFETDCMRPGERKASSVLRGRHFFLCWDGTTRILSPNTSFQEASTACNGLEKDTECKKKLLTAVVAKRINHNSNERQAEYRDQPSRQRRCQVRGHATVEIKISLG